MAAPTLSMPARSTYSTSENAVDQVIFNWAVAVAGALGGWVLKVIWDAIRDMRKDLQAHEQRSRDDLKALDTKMHEDFVRRDDFKEAIKEIKEDMRQGFNKVDTTLGAIFKKLDRTGGGSNDF